MKIIFASGNANKIEELKHIIPQGIILTSMREMGFQGDIDETGSTLEENAKIKADFIHQLFHQSCFSDDSGLEIEALGGRPGVFSARYAGANCSFEDNVQKVLSEMNGIRNRNATFRTVIHLIHDNQHHVFSGEIQGTITETPAGVEGFGYDPIFRPNGYENTFAEMPLEVKNRISHRALAVEKLIAFLTGL